MIAQNYRRISLFGYFRPRADGDVYLPLKHEYRLAVAVHMWQKAKVLVYYGVEIISPHRIVRLIHHVKRLSFNKAQKLISVHYCIT